MAEQAGLMTGGEVLQCVPPLLAAGRHHRQHPLHEPAPRVALGPATGLAPDHRMPQRPLRRVIRRVHAHDARAGTSRGAPRPPAVPGKSPPSWGKPNSDTVGEFVWGVWNRDFASPGVPILPKLRPVGRRREFANSISKRTRTHRRQCPSVHVQLRDPCVCGLGRRSEPSVRLRPAQILCPPRLGRYPIRMRAILKPSWRPIRAYNPRSAHLGLIFCEFVTCWY
jgi:hypothetical protein